MFLMGVTWFRRAGQAETDNTVSSYRKQKVHRLDVAALCGVTAHSLPKCETRLNANDEQFDVALAA
jgi:hypothetical protein